MRLIPSFQSRNRVWAGSRTSVVCFKPVSPEFQSRNRVWAGSRIKPPGAIPPPIMSFNLAIEFGPVHAVMPGVGRQRLHRFQSRNRVWAGSRRAQLAAGQDNTQVSISQSSLGRFTLGAHGEQDRVAEGFQSRNRVWAGSRPNAAHALGIAMAGFNLAIEFGPVHACWRVDGIEAMLRFQSRNRVWAGSRGANLKGANLYGAVSISQSRVGRVN